MTDQQPFRSGREGGLGGLQRSRMARLAGKGPVGVGESGFVVEQVGSPDERCGLGRVERVAQIGVAARFVGPVGDFGVGKQQGPVSVSTATSSPRLAATHWAMPSP